MQVSPIPGVNFGIILVNYCCERLLTRDKIAISIKSCLKEKPALYCIARYCVLPALEQEQAEHVLNEAALHSLTELFEAVPDPRCRHGLRYDLPFLLTCLVAALLCNCDGTEAVAQWCRDHRCLLQGEFGPRLFLAPSGSLYRWLLPQLDACALERVLGKWVQATTKAPADEPLALDGKTIRGARTGEQAAPHLLAFVTHHSQEAFFQVRGRGAGRQLRREAAQRSATGAATADAKSGIMPI